MSNIFLSLAGSASRLLPLPVKLAIYRSPRLARIVRRGLNSLAPPGLISADVVSGNLAGARLWIDFKTEKDYWLGIYEPGLQSAIARLVEPGMVAYDVGASVGYITLMLARAVGEDGRVYAFEALPANLERLRANLENNPEGSWVTVVPAAVTDASGITHFLIGPSSATGKAVGSIGRRELEYPSSIQVDCVSLDEFITTSRNPAPQVLKLDIEGGEVLALPGMRRLLASAKPILLMELHGPEAAQVAWKELTAVKYRLCRMDADFSEAPSLEALEWKEYLIGFPPS